MLGSVHACVQSNVKKYFDVIENNVDNIFQCQCQDRGTIFSTHCVFHRSLRFSQILLRIEEFTFYPV